MAIMGLGLMGGSLGLAARQRGAAGTVHAYARRDPSRRAARRMGAVDRAFSRPADAVHGADLVVFCLPVLAIPELARSCKGGFMRGAVATDVGSTKAVVTREMLKILEDTDVSFVGSHPMAGSERAGIHAARADLYEGATVAVTTAASGDGQVGPGKRVTTEALQRIRSFWRDLGARVVDMPAEAHDRIVARTSHLPHMVASILVATVFRDKAADLQSMLGRGFLDTTRVAAGDEGLWHDILKSNRDALDGELVELEKTLRAVRQMLKREDFEGMRLFLGRARKQREAAGRRCGRRAE